MSTPLEHVTTQDYKYGFVTDIASESAPPGLSEDIIRFISAKKGEPAWLLAFRLKAYRHWLTLTEPTWAKVSYEKPDFQKIVYYSAPKPKEAKHQSLDEVDPELLRTFEKLGVPIEEQKALAGVAVDVGGTATTGCGGAAIDRMAGVAVATITTAASSACKPMV